MHELAICQALMKQLEQQAARHNASRIERVVLSVGPLSGVENALLARAFTVARAGSVASGAELDIETGPVRVRCRNCFEESAVASNRLVCGSCGDWKVTVIEGEELMLVRLEFAEQEVVPNDPAAARCGGQGV